jgi:hypothetical protein
VSARSRAGEHRARAFGLDIDSDFQLLGVAGPPEYTGTRPVAIETVSNEVLAATIGAGATQRLVDVPDAFGRALVTIDAVEGERLGFAIRSKLLGGAWISRDGRRMLCCPKVEPAWKWQRFLVGQLLPFASVLRGLEVFHASAVVAGDSAVAIVAGSGVGKTSLALNLALDGNPFLNDDVLVLEPVEDGSVLAHPGAGLANVSEADTELASRLERAGLGHRLGAADGESRIAVTRHPRPVPLGAIFFLERVTSGDRAGIERLAPVDPRLLLASTFNLVVRSPDRLARQLDVCARLAESCAFFKVTSPPAVDAAQLARQINRAVVGREPQVS